MADRRQADTNVGLPGGEAEAPDPPAAAEFEVPRGEELMHEGLRKSTGPVGVNLPGRLRLRDGGFGERGPALEAVMVVGLSAFFVPVKNCWRWFVMAARWSSGTLLAPQDWIRLWSWKISSARVKKKRPGEISGPAIAEFEIDEPADGVDSRRKIDRAFGMVSAANGRITVTRSSNLIRAARTPLRVKALWAPFIVLYCDIADSCPPSEERPRVVNPPRSDCWDDGSTNTLARSQPGLWVLDRWSPDDV